ncbi:hypothetical protein HTZ97_14705 [Desulfuromonas acetoxidans]|uniref:tetratricopeptide repeat protein n=1 Tax=Desulfuromonas acetoxidans TaxID=891 RepID=UPI000326B60B|nr:hypothetical protein [Desulfuromonas acetoxidans]NVD25655.1 hypothetical protein [Desulfuromonas acetoxidans]NVE17708.1 hypothetical protein [Desulfuromonas acetoxidans]
MRRLFSVCCLFFLIVAGSVSSFAAPQRFVLQKIDKQDEVNVTRLTLKFNKVPEIKVNTSGQKLEIELKSTLPGSEMVYPTEDERLVRTLIGQAKDKLMVSFLMRRPPYFVNTSKELRTGLVMIDVHWRDAQNAMRPAIARKLPGQVSQLGGVGRRGINSEYRGDWLRFFDDYELPVTIPAQIHYTTPPFPALALLGPVDDVLPVEVEELAAADEWDAAIAALRNIGFESTTGLERVRFLLLMSELALRGGNYKLAEKRVAAAQAALPEDDAVLTEYARLLHMYIAARQFADPYQLMAALELDAQRQEEAQFSVYSELLHAEVALATNDMRSAQIVLDAQMKQGKAGLESRYQQRQADVWFDQGDYAAAVERYQSLANQLADFPSSLANFAMSLYRQKDYDGAIVQLKRFLEGVDDPESRDMARYLLAMSMIHRGDKDAGYDLLHQIIPGTQGALLAKAKIADLSMVVDDFHSRRRARNDYAELAGLMVDRDRRAEMQFKQALGSYLLGQRLEAVDELRYLLRSDRMTNLAGHAQALLADILPDLIRGMIEDKKYFSALVLVEQNRDLLVASQRDFDFLIGLGEVFSQLELSDRAVRLYLYLLDHAAEEQQTRQVYIPLLEALMQQQAYDRVIDYANRYAQKYPQGSQWPKIFQLKLEAMLALGQEDAVFSALKQKDRPKTEALDKLLAHLAWKRGDIDLVMNTLVGLIGNDLSQEDPADLLVLAEAYRDKKNNAQALKLFRYLQQGDYRDQAVYREAQILLRQGQRQDGLKLLRQLVEEAQSSEWRSLAEETLAIERFDR